MRPGAVLAGIARRVEAIVGARLFVAALAAIAALPLAAASAAQAGAPANPAARHRAAKPAKSAPPAVDARRKAALSEQHDLQQRLARLRRQLASTEASQTDATDALRASEAAISAANRRLRELATARTEVETQISDLQDRGRTALRDQITQERSLALVLRAQFVAARAAPWQRLLDGDDPNRIGREQRYLDYMSRAQYRTIGELRGQRDHLAALESESRARQKELDAIVQAESDSRAQLLREQAAHQLALARAGKQIKAQRESIAALERDDRRLSSLVDQLTRMLDAQERQRRQPNSSARNGRAASPRPSSGSAVASLPPAAPLTPKMRLALPVQGEIVARFGSPRRTEAGVDAPAWKGLLIRAPQGAEVHAVAAGKVVFSDWLRGFGNLVIVDHGNGVMSVYGNNATLTRSIGDRVARGDVIAEVGNTGGMPEPGLYFEVRDQGRPIDPLQWIAAR